MQLIITQESCSLLTDWTCQIIQIILGLFLLWILTFPTFLTQQVLSDSILNHSLMTDSNTEQCQSKNDTLGEKHLLNNSSLATT